MSARPTPLPCDRWLVPGARAFGVFFPDAEARFRSGAIRYVEARGIAEATLRRVVQSVMVRYPSTSVSVADAVQQLEIRVAEMDAARKYDPTRGSPRAYLAGIARLVVLEIVARRVPLANAIDPDRMAGPPKPFNVDEERERRVRLAEWLNNLSPREMRALVNEFGPLGDRSCDVGSRRRQSKSLSRAIATLRGFGSRSQAAS